MLAKYPNTWKCGKPVDKMTNERQTKIDVDPMQWQSGMEHPSEEKVVDTLHPLGLCVCFRDFEWKIKLNGRRRLQRFFVIYFRYFLLCGLLPPTSAFVPCGFSFLFCFVIRNICFIFGHF